MKEVNERVGRNIYLIRKKKGYTQETLASRVGTTKSSISRVEKYGSAAQSTLERIAKALNVDINAFYMKQNSEEEKNYTEVLCNNFIKENIKNSIRDNEFESFFKLIHDEAVRGFADKIKISQDEKFKDYALPVRYDNKDSFTRREVVELCILLNKEFVLNTYSILTGNK